MTRQRNALEHFLLLEKEGEEDDGRAAFHKSNVMTVRATKTNILTHTRMQNEYICTSKTGELCVCVCVCLSVYVVTAHCPEVSKLS